MAKEEILYVCDVCGQKYQKLIDAEKCEKSHLTVKKITKVVYDKNDRKKWYPDSVNVLLINGNGEEETIPNYRKKW